MDWATDRSRKRCLPTCRSRPRAPPDLCREARLARNALPLCCLVPGTAESGFRNHCCVEGTCTDRTTPPGASGRVRVWSHGTDCAAAAPRTVAVLARCCGVFAPLSLLRYPRLLLERWRQP